MKDAALHLVTLALIFQLNAQNQSQKTKLSVKDTSLAGSPIQATGQAVIVSEITSQGIESTAELSGVLKNISSEPIMAFEVVIDLYPSYGGGDRKTSRSDYFFEDSPMMPSSTSEIAVAPHRTIVYWNRP